MCVVVLDKVIHARSLILTHEYIRSHTQLYSHLKAYVEALLAGMHTVSELSVNLCLPIMEWCISQLNSGKSPNGHK